MFFIYKCTLLVFVIEVIHGQDGPCSTIFQYRNDNNYLYGRIEVPYPVNNDNIIKLDVQLSIANSKFSSESIKRITFLGSVNDLVLKRPLVFRVDFPPWCNILPKITLISVNNITLCCGTAIKEGLVTTITLVTILKITPLPLNSTNKQPPIEETTDYSDNMCHLQFNDKHNSHKIQRSPLQWTSELDPDIQDLNYVTLRTSANIQHDIVSDGCGYSTSLVDDKTEIQKNTHPWMGALFRRELTSPKLLCGATLITPKLALTAAHCVVPYLVGFELYLTFGKTNLLDWFDVDSQTARVDAIVVHPDYRNDSEDADIAILIFAKELSLTPTIQPVCLWNGENSLDNQVTKEGIIVDWNKNDNFEIKQHLQHNYAVVVDKQECLRSSIGILSNHTICAETRNNSDHCDGYSGSAVYFLLNGRWTLRGIVSRSLLASNETCDLPQYVAVLDVAKYSDWIKIFL